MSETSGELETMRPNPVWTAEAYKDSLDVWREVAEDVMVKVWGGDWCKDCRSQLPDFGAGLVVETNGEEIARFVEEADRPILVYLADELEARD